ncbi:MAG: ATP-binding cassette domain-containing protein [Turicibacter sp.]|nr:ATP-binding cassette domain-containing protein [Turicibacter sp.]
MIQLKNVEVSFKLKGRTVNAVRAVNLEIEQGDIYGIVGYSGAGKSTLVRLINLLQKPTGGEVIVDGTNLLDLSPKALRQERKSIGMIFQHFNLMKSRTIFQNVEFPLKYTGKSKEERRKKVEELLELVGLSDKLNAYPSQLSGGQKQRVAIARALANDPKILLCDEATSALDPRTTRQILQLLKELNQKLGLTIVLITHEMQVVKDICSKVAVMEDGHVIEEGFSINIFNKPQEKLTQDFIQTATHMDHALETILNNKKFSELEENQWLVELSYLGFQTNEPIISHLYSNYQVTANILYGNIEILQDVPIGKMIVVLSGESRQRKKALEYLKENGVEVNILKRHDSESVLKFVKGGA